MMKNLLKLSIIVVILFNSFLFAQTNANEKLNIMQNSLLLGLEEIGIKTAVEIISKSEYKSVKEKALFTIAEYFFSEGVLGNLDESTRLYKGNIQYINKAYTFYKRLSTEYPNSELKQITQQRIEFLEFNYQSELLFRSLGNYLENERVVVQKKFNFMNLFVNKKDENPFLFFDKGDEPNTFALINRYLDDIIVNNSSQAIFAYYYKLLLILSRGRNVDIIDGTIEKKSISILGDKSFNVDQEAVAILNILRKSNPHHPLTIKAYLVTVSYLIKADIWDYDSWQTKKWLEIALKNDNNKLGIKHLVTKEYILKTEFDE